eukprot:NODE_9427_length_319_cov_60.362963_g7660_i0.p3 GENE.NODE_9427_length_319_cov_60.362963_g7660_i0~~NODE_9427_length_319_cov_60.362963_g7660_i0.p3  ORF type:complete len:54 (+),score=6.66 NODE_9427_length_319_cov_60.362963_g7660_i0:87-248(+)
MFECCERSRKISRIEGNSLLGGVMNSLRSAAPVHGQGPHGLAHSAPHAGPSSF